ncbi:unnamed protein product, partial [Ectocarpus sp. 12 AP-2014]
MNGQGGAEEGNMPGGGKAEVKDKKEKEAAVEETLPWRPRPGVGRKKTENPRRAIATASGSEGTYSFPPGASTEETDGGGGRGASSRDTGADALKGEADVVTRRKTGAEMLSRLDAR